jgi:hypothetical protein
MPARAPAAPRSPRQLLLWKTEPLLTIRNKKVYRQ